MRFQCPFCKGIVSVDNGDVGIDVQCGHCREVVTVPVSRVSAGAVIGDFIIIRELGRGGMGVVYLVHQMSLDRPAALKVLAENYANNAEFVVGFIKEARAAAKLNHPNIVQAYAVGEDEGIFYFAMENIDGETMKQVLAREHKIPVDQALSIIQQIAEALDYAWKEQHLIHRDIKPDNIMLTSSGRAKLADLGLARIAEDIDDADDDEVMGTPQYISPEHLTGAPMDVRSDIYSLGATFYHFITGRFPFEGRTATEIAKKHLEEKLVPPNQINRNIPLGVSRIIEKMMAKNPKARYQDAEELVDDLRMARHGKEPLAATSTVHGMIRQKTTARLRISTKRPTSASLKSDVATTTGPVGGTSTSLNTRTDIYHLKKIREEQTRRRLLILGIAAAVLTVVVVSISIGINVSRRKSHARRPAAETEHQTQETMPQKEPKSTAYTLKADQILKFARTNSESRHEIWSRCEDFFKNFPKPKYKVENDRLQALLQVYVPIDEVRMNELRVELRKKHIEEVQGRKKAFEQAEKEAAEKAKREAEARAAEERRKREAEAKAAQTARELKTMQERLVTDKETLSHKMLSLMMKSDYAGAKEALAPLLKEEEAAKGKDPKIVAIAQELTAWGARMTGILEKAEKIQKAYTDGGDLLSGSQLEIRSELYKLKEIKNGTVYLLSYESKKTFSMNLSHLTSRQQASLLKKAAAQCGEEENFFFRLLAEGDFQQAKESAPENWKQDLSSIITSYFKKELSGASAEKKARLQKGYGKLEEFQKAEKESGASS